MIKDTFTALIYDVLKVLQSNKDFFKQDESAKAKLIKESGFFPEEVVKHLSTMSEKALLKDIEETLAFTSEGETTTALKSGIAKAFAEFCINQVPKHLDEYKADSKPLYKGAFGRYLSTFYSSGVEKQIIEQIQDFLSLVHKSSYVLVQTPIQLTQEQKTSIREELIGKYPHSIPSFSVNKKLIGGLRVFVDGKTHDHSWISQINKLTSITNK